MTNNLSSPCPFCGTNVPDAYDTCSGCGAERKGNSFFATVGGFGILISLVMIALAIEEDGYSDLYHFSFFMIVGSIFALWLGSFKSWQKRKIIVKANNHGGWQ